MTYTVILGSHRADGTNRLVLALRLARLVWRISKSPTEVAIELESRAVALEHLSKVVPELRVQLHVVDVSGSTCRHPWENER